MQNNKKQLYTTLSAYNTSVSIQKQDQAIQVLFECGARTAIFSINGAVLYNNGFSASQMGYFHRFVMLHAQEILQLSYID